MKVNFRLCTLHFREYSKVSTMFVYFAIFECSYFRDKVHKDKKVYGKLKLEEFIMLPKVVEAACLFL